MAVPLLSNIHYSGTKAAGEFLLSIGTAIVGDQNLPLDGEISERLLSLTDARGEGLGLVQAWHEDCQNQRRGHRAKDADLRGGQQY